MTDTTTIAPAALSANLTRQRVLWDAREEVLLDLAIAKRANDADAVKRAEDAQAENRHEWYQLGLKNKLDAELWIRSHGIDPVALRSALS